jgi:hypothetical protein
LRGLKVARKRAPGLLLLFYVPGALRKNDRSPPQTIRGMNIVEYAAATAAVQLAANADFEAVAHAAGAHDAAAVVLMTARDQIRLSDAGKIINAAELVAAMKVAKPYFFTATRAPSKPATAMSVTEYAAAKATVIRESATGQRATTAARELAAIIAKYAAKEPRA